MPVAHEVEADWDDTDASVEVALHRVEMALVKKTTGPAESDLERRYQLLTHTDEPAELILRRDHLEDGPQAITLEAHVGRFGDPDEEAALIRAVRHRLKALAGVTHAPLTEPR